MKTIAVTIAVAVTAALAAAAPGRADACTITATPQLRQYYPYSGAFISTTPHDVRCDWSGNSWSCNLSGWLFTPSAPTSDFGGVIYIPPYDSTNRNDSCEIVNKLVGRGYAVFIPGRPGQDDTSPGSTHYHDTGQTMDQWLQHDTRLSYYQQERYSVGSAAHLLTTVTVNGHHVGNLAVIGQGYGGALALISSSMDMSPYPIKAYVDLSGALFDYGDSPLLADAMVDAAAAHRHPVMFADSMMFATASGTVPWMFEPFFAADQASVSDSQLALYDTFTRSADSSATCAARGYSTARCNLYAYAAEGNLVDRWLEPAIDFIVDAGVTH